MTDITYNQVYAVGVPIVLFMILVEVLASSWDKKSYYNKGDTFCTIGLLLGNIAMVYAFKGLTLALHFYVFQFKLFDIFQSMPLWTNWILAFILIDFIFYIYHRMSHRVRFLWAIHMSHHSSEEMNFAVSFRQAWFGPVSKIPFFISSAIGLTLILFLSKKILIILKSFSQSLFKICIVSSHCHIS